MSFSELPMEPFRVRLNCLDHYQGDSSEFDPPLSSEASRNYARPKVPIIRAFGATETGQKVCAHIHGAFPYLYVEYRESLESDLGQSDAINQKGMC
jgi:DNA polymerase zeta